MKTPSSFRRNYLFISLMLDKLLLIAKESQGPYYLGYAADFRTQMCGP